MTNKILKVLCYLGMILTVLVMYLKALGGETIKWQITGIVLLFVAYKLVCFCEKK